VRKERIDSTAQPALARAVAAASAAARTSRCTGRPTPMSGRKPMRSCFDSKGLNPPKLSSWGGRLMKSLASGRATMLMRSAASATVRVIGPVTRPI
jgi:hypothetical protein